MPYWSAGIQNPRMMRMARKSRMPTSELAVPTHASPRLTWVFISRLRSGTGVAQSTGYRAAAPGRQLDDRVARVVPDTMIKRALILAAGYGSRLREGGVDLPKPLQVVRGETLLVR